jgi:lipopolysaccharide export system permease protein
VKILDKYLLKTFLITFTTVFVILFFIFILQTVWLFISELTGKGLDVIMILKFLLFAMPRLIPLVLPLSVLLASIMTFGSLSENYEFAAMKSSGISFQRTLRSTTAFIILLSVISFFFANNVIPYAEYKFINFRRNIAQVKPAMAIAEGQFSEVGNYTIKVDKKSGDKGNYLTGVTIHKKLDNGEGNTTVIKAEKGELVSSETSNTLKLVLTNGNYYEDVIPTDYAQRNKVPFAKGTFKRDVINIDLSKLNQSSMASVDISNNTTMLNIHELRFTLDSLNKNYKKDLISYADNIYLRTSVANTFYVPPTTLKLKKITDTDFLKKLPKMEQQEIYKIAINNIENTTFTISSSQFEMEAKEKNINSHWIAFYDKFMIAFSCLLMFFIGAPLGSIIRKGGLGLPIVFAVSIFIVFHFINTFGKRVAQENEMSAFMGVWMSSLILTPLAILLTYRAINDIGGMVSFDGILDPLKKTLVFQKIKSLFINSSEKEEITDESIAVAEKFTVVYPKELIAEYQKITKFALALYAVTLAIALLLIKINTVLVLILGAIALLAFLYFIFKAQKKLEEIEIQIHKKIEPGIWISLLVAFPFYIILYLYTKKELSKLLTTNN